MSTDNILVALSDGFSEDSASELAAVARSLIGTDGGSAAAVLMGSNVSDAGHSLSRLFDDVFVFDDEALDPPDGETYAQVISGLVEREQPRLVLMPHSNNGIDMAPFIAVRTRRPLLTDCVKVSHSGGRLSALRPVYGGKLYARVMAVQSELGHVVTMRPGSAPNVGAGDGDLAGVAGNVHDEEFKVDYPVRRRYLSTVAPESGSVDISTASRLVAVGRGIEDEENMELIVSLAEAMDAEVACSRPVVDKQWLEKSRQVGTSGVTVKPELYVAIGISGSFQHLGGVKGDPFIVAINKDPRAPIFEVADLGVVGDLFDIVPLLDQKIRSLKS
jgi:electron transfer flavoprotein alpha subunit